MSSSEPPSAEPSANGPSQAPAKKDRHQGHKHTKRNLFKKRDKKEPADNAPLLVDDAPNDMDDASIEEGQPQNREPAKGGPDGSWPSRAVSWTWENLMSVCIAILLLGGIVVLVVYFAVSYSMGTPVVEVAPKICLTPSCVVAASNIIENMSPRYQDLDPCVDFDKYVCEGFDEKYDLRPDQRSLFAGTIMAENNQKLLRHILESPYKKDVYMLEADSSRKGSIFRKLKNAYDACMDEEQIRTAGSGPLLVLLKEIDSLFPAAKPTRSEDAFPKMPDEIHKGIVFEAENQLTRVIAYLNGIGVDAIVALDVGPDDKDPDSTVPSISAPRRPGLPSKEYYKDHKVVQNYAQVIGQVLEGLLHEARRPNASAGLFSTSSIIARSAGLVEELIVFESKLAKATPDTEDAEDVTKFYNAMTPEETRALLPQLSIPSVISDSAPSGCSPSKLIVGSPSYLRNVSSILKSTSKEALQAYLVWKTVQRFADNVRADALKPLQRFNNELSGKDADSLEERWRTCIKTVDHGLGWILSKFFVEKSFSKEAKDFGDNIISDIKVQFIKKLGKAEWMSEDVQNLGIAKVHNIIQKIGYPTKSPDIRDSSDLEQYYGSVNISRDAYFSNELSVAQFAARKEWSALCKPTDRDEWDMTADIVNAYYSPAGNEIVFPAGIMQSPVFYDPSVPQYLSYGAFGSVSGHELSHAFDSLGRHYDETGNFTDWWDEKTIKAFKDKVQCFVDQYHDFTVPNPNGEPLHVNGKLTLGENLADAGGLSASFLAWKENDNRHPGQLLPGLQNFTKEQVFFLSYANFWCGKTRPETAVNLIYTDPHAPIRARILGTLANSRGFREAFSCSSKEPTCELW